MFHKSPGDELPLPCPQMKNLLSALSDNTLTGIPRWYATHHVQGCAHCAATLSSLNALRDRLQDLGVPALDGGAAGPGLTDERRLAVQAALAGVDGG